MKIDVNEILSNAELKCKQSLLTYLNEKNIVWIFKYCFPHFYVNHKAKSFEFVVSIKKKIVQNSEIENNSIDTIISDSYQGLEIYRCRLPFMPLDAITQPIKGKDKNELSELNLNEFDENPDYILLFNLDQN